MPTLKEMREAGKTMDEIADMAQRQRPHDDRRPPVQSGVRVAVVKRYLGDDFLGKVKDRGGKPQMIRCMEKTA